MPTIHHIAATTERRCIPCEHLKVAGYHHCRLTGTTCAYKCHHPEAELDKADPSETDPVFIQSNAHLRELSVKYGREIGRTDRQPSWCPLRREADGSNTNYTEPTSK